MKEILCDNDHRFRYDWNKILYNFDLSQQGISIFIKDDVSIENHPECHCYTQTNCYLAIPLLKFKGSNLSKVESKHWIFC